MNLKSIKSTIALAVLSSLSVSAIAETEQLMEEVSVVVKKLTRANHVIDASMTKQVPNISSVLAVMDKLPGININEGDAFGGDDWSTSITMRGFSIDSNSQQLGMTIDGIPNGGSNYGGGAKANRFIDAENMETIEVSQGTSDISSASLEALGGTFNFVSAQPLTYKETTLAFTKGDHDATRYFARHDTGEIFDGTTTAYASYSQTSTSRWVGEGSNGGAERQHAEVKFVTDLGQLSITGRLSYDDADEDNYNSVTKAEFEQTPDWDRLTWNWTGVPHVDQYFAEGWSTLRENTLGYVKFEYDIDSSMSFQITPYFHKNKGRGDWIPPYLTLPVDASGNPATEGGSSSGIVTFTDTNGTPLTAAEGCTSSYAFPYESGPAFHEACFDRDAVPVMSYRHTHYEKSRLGLTANFDMTIGNNDISMGLWTETNNRDESRDWHKVIDASTYHYFDNQPYWTQYDNEFTTDTLKFYIEDTLSLDDFTLNVGAQKYLVEIEKFDKFTNKVTGKVDSDSDVLFSIGGIYQINEEMEVFAGFSENFSAISDGVLERDASSLTQIQPETAENMELGLRYNTSNIQFSATYYQVDFENRITFIAPGSDTGGIDFLIGTNGTYINVGGIESDGFELSLNYQLNDNVSLYSSYTNNDSTYIGDAAGFNAGDRVNDSIEEMFVFSADYTEGNLHTGASVKYTGDRGVADSYTILNFNAGYSAQIDNNMFKTVDIALVVTNVTDEDYLSTGTGNGLTYFIGAPRTATMTFTASF
jgi:iron complex outermembrane receptor protein